MKAPTRPSDISKDWIQYILSDYEKRENPGTTVSVESYETSLGSKLGDGSHDEVITIQVNARISKDSANSHRERKEYNLAIKLKGRDPRTEFILEKTKVYLKELLMYSKILVEFDNFQKNLANNQYPIPFPKFIYGIHTEEEFILVIEHIKDSGFSFHNKGETFNFEHLKMAVTQLVRLHAVSYSYNQSYPFLERHPTFEKTDYSNFFLRLGNKAILDVVFEILKKEKISINQDLAAKIKSNKKELIKQCVEIHNESSYKLLCLVHADVHASNMMFTYDDDDEDDDTCVNPSDIRLLDWQTPNWNTPAMDLHSLIYSTTSRDFRKEHLQDILKFYHETFVEATSNMRVEGLNWTYEDFKSDFNRMGLYGFIKGIFNAFTHHCPELIQENEDEKRNATNQSKFVKTLTNPLYKLMQKYILSSTVETLMNNGIKSSLLKYVNQITTRQNENLSSRVLGLIYEADENGLFG